MEVVPHSQWSGELVFRHQLQYVGEWVLHLTWAIQYRWSNDESTWASQPLAAAVKRVDLVPRLDSTVEMALVEWVW